MWIELAVALAKLGGSIADAVNGRSRDERHQRELDREIRVRDWIEQRRKERDQTSD